ncbi:hypothetical protein [Chryseobacterium sp.]|uniref:hypothetical protein n=1 Tax=Chryseobacterium sp. TaxID=1871047 RepID=UPI0024E244E2|nr:hypothetical protein [Chryseobacterium sp.]
MDISSKDFKQILNGTSIQDKLFSYIVQYESDKIILNGDFKLSDDIIFEENEIYDKEIIFDGGTYKNIIFLGAKFNKVLFRRGDFNGFVSIRGGTIKNLILLGGNFKHWLGTLDGILNNENEVLKTNQSLKINRFEIEGGSYTNNIWISGGDISSLEIKCVTPVKIHCLPNDDKIFDIKTNTYTKKYSSKPRIKNFLISRYSNRDTFYHLSELDLDTLKFENFTNIGNITISKISISESLSFENSDLGKTTFIDCNFFDQKMIFDSSKITEIALAGTSLPNPINIDSTNTDKTSQQKLALSQIKKVYQNMGDNLTASQYHTEELNTYLSTLSCGAEKINLSLNKFTNKHGQSWERALLLLFASTIILYSLYCNSLGFKINCKSNGVNYFWKNASYLLEFLNPIRKSDFLPKILLDKSESEISPASIFIDNISKIINSYLIYQFVAAFRKFGKKSE